MVGRGYRKAIGQGDSMTRDDIYQVVYKCSVCSQQAQVDDTSLARIADEFEHMGWGDVEGFSEGKVIFTVYCPECYERVYRVNQDEARAVHVAEEARYLTDEYGPDWEHEEELHMASMDELDSMDDERQGLWT